MEVVGVVPLVQRDGKISRGRFVKLESREGGEWRAAFRIACFHERTENTAQYSSHFISHGHVVMPVIF